MLKKLTFGVMLVMIFFLSACGNDAGIWFNESKEGFLGRKDGKLFVDIWAKIDSVAELKGLCEEWENSTEYEIYYETYNEAFFADKVLIVAVFTHGHIGTSIINLTVKNEVLSINMRSTKKKWGLNYDILEGRSCLIEVARSDIVNVTEIQVKFKGSLNYRSETLPSRSFH